MDAAKTLQPESFPTIANSLCDSCDHAPSCALKAHTSTPIVQCNEHRASGMTTRPLPGLGVAARVVIGRGLCPRCDHVASCINANLERGIWHCEDYR